MLGAHSRQRKSSNETSPLELMFKVRCLARASVFTLRPAFSRQTFCFHQSSHRLRISHYDPPDMLAERPAPSLSSLPLPAP